MRTGLKVAILLSGKTQRRIALECDMPEGRLSGIVRGSEDPTVAERAALSTALGRPADVLFGAAAVDLRVVGQ